MQCFVRLASRLAQLRGMAQADQQVPAAGHLLSRGCGGAGRIGIGAGVVAGDYLGARTL